MFDKIKGRFFIFWHGFRFAVRMARFAIWRYPRFIFRFVQYFDIDAKMKELNLPEDEQEILRNAWLYGEEDGLIDYPECPRCFTRYDAQHQLEWEGKTYSAREDGVCMSCQVAENVS